MTCFGEVLVTSFWDGPAKAKAVTVGLTRFDGQIDYAA
jgi:hypothetical protein